MRASLDFRLVFLGLIALLVPAGCGNGSDQTSLPPPPLTGDAGVSRTVKVDSATHGGAGGGAGGATAAVDSSSSSSVDAVVDGVVGLADAGDAMGDGGDAMGDAGDAVGDAGDAAPLPPSITVTIDPASLVPPGDGGVPATLIVPANYGPKPVVTVTVVSNSGDMRADNLSSATASLNDPVAGTQVAFVTLAKSETDTAPESNTVRFIFSDVPLDLSKVPTGAYDLLVTATTVGGASASTKLALWVDTGPTVVVKSPTEGGFYKGSAPVEVDATQPQFAITLVTMVVGQGNVVSLMQTSQGVYKGTIDFFSFTPPLDGDQLVTFRAYDENGVETDATVHFVSDNTGPSITNTVPGLGAMIGSVITISATVDDPAGVDASSVVAVVGNGSQNFEVALSPSVGKTYSSLFDTTKLPSYAILPTISFRARDVLGNESTVSYELSLDNTPPIIDLDPPNVRVANSSGFCSWAFDPVGPDAVDDGDQVTQLFDVRVRAEDRGNTPLTGDADFVPIGGVDPQQVKLLILSNTSRPLVVDTSDPPDGLCDDINPDLVPTTKPQTDTDAQLVNMVPMSPGGTADFSTEPGVACANGGGSPPDPGAFCWTTENLSKAQYAAGDSTPHCYTMTEVLSYSANNLSSIYTIGPIVNDGLQCAGRQFDAGANNLKDGWACLAVVASDTLGNKQVSRPIRICVTVTAPASTSCPDFKAVTAIVLSDPVEIDTSAPLVGPGGAALQANDEVVVSAVLGVSGINQRWKVTPLDASGMRFSLQGAHGTGATSLAVTGLVVPVAAMPDCTGTVIKGGTDGGLPVVDYTKPCTPWRSFPANEQSAH